MISPRLFGVGRNIAYLEHIFFRDKIIFSPCFFFSTSQIVNLELRNMLLGTRRRAQRAGEAGVGPRYIFNFIFLYMLISDPGGSQVGRSSV